VQKNLMFICISGEVKEGAVWYDTSNIGHPTTSESCTWAANELTMHGLFRSEKQRKMQDPREGEL